MTPDIEKLAREAGLEYEVDETVFVYEYIPTAASGQCHGGTLVMPPQPAKLSELRRFAALIRAQVLEEAAALCDTMASDKEFERNEGLDRVLGRDDCAEAIRALLQR
jgi:hypothetical protein